jgi:serine/threonine-protein kinase
VAVYDIGTADDRFFIVSELIEGRTLRERLRSGPLRTATAIDYAAQVARGLTAAHARGVVHRDLKPENLMVTTDGRVKILDFGVAKVERPADPAADSTTLPTGGYTLPGTLIGTVAYMSPEQVRGEAVDVRTDVFSLGSILYEMIAGFHPFNRASTADTISAILRDAPARIDGAPAGVEAIVQRSLEKARDRRFPTAADLASALELEARRLEDRGTLVAPAGPRSAPTIAVLPFSNLSPDAESEYFSDGLTEELIQALTRVSQLKVVAWNSALQMKGREADLRAVAERLNVATVLVGSVRKSGERVRIAARLVEAATGLYLWSETYDRQTQDVFAIQEEIARAIVGMLARTLGEGQPRRHDRRQGTLDAYNHYLKGRFLWNKRTRDGFEKSVECFERAIGADADFALGYSGLADAYCLLADYGIVHPADAMPKARSAAIRALEIDPRSGEAHASFALIRALFDWEWLEAEALFRRALELSPGYATAHHWLGVDLLALVGRFDEAELEVDAARQLDPLSLIIHEGLAYLSFLSRRYAEAIEAYKALGELDASFPRAYTSLGRVYIHTGDYDEAIRMLEQGLRLSGPVPSILGALGQAHGLAGDADAARRRLADLTTMSAERYVPSTTFAFIHAGLGENGRALDWLERAAEGHELPLAGVKVHPAYDSLRAEPRFSALLQKLRLAD